MTLYRSIRRHITDAALHHVRPRPTFIAVLSDLRASGVPNAYDATVRLFSRFPHRFAPSRIEGNTVPSPTVPLNNPAFGLPVSGRV